MHSSIPFRVLITDRAWPDCELEAHILSEIGAQIVEAPRQDEATLSELAADADAIATCWAPVTDQMVRSAKRCRVIARFGIGLDNISVATATELRIPVTNVPDYCLPEVSDHTLALLLCCARQIGFFHSQTKRGTYDLQAAPPMRRLSNQVLGLIGFGRIGREVYRKASALGLTVLAHTPSGNDYGTGCPLVSFEEILDRADFISLHAPLTDQTRGLFGMKELRRMKRSATLINTARGALIDPEALWTALQAGEIAGAALDVFDPEPPDLSHPLYRDDRVIVTPHAAFVSRESVRELRIRTMKQIIQVLQGERPENLVNPEAIDFPSSPEAS